MKTNLDSIFKTNTNDEVDGIWMDINETVGFRVARFGGANDRLMKAASAKYYKPYARQADKGTLDSKKEREIMVNVFVGSCLRDWKGVEADGQEIPFSHEAAVKLFLALPDLFDTLHEYASDISSFREDLGND